MMKLIYDAAGQFLFIGIFVLALMIAFAALSAPSSSTAQEQTLHYNITATVDTPDGMSRCYFSDRGYTMSCVKK